MEDFMALPAEDAARAAAAGSVAPKPALEHQKALRQFIALRREGGFGGDPLAITNRVMARVLVLRIRAVMRSTGRVPTKATLSTWIGRVKGGARSRAW